MNKFWSKVRITPGCWLWTGSVNTDGYGHVKIEGKLRLAHRVSYETCVGPIPPGLQLDHVRALGCVHRNCVNWSHLEPVTAAVNVRRGMSGKFQSAKTHCRSGHEYSETNTYRNGGRRHCRTCHRGLVNRQRHMEKTQ